MTLFSFGKTKKRSTRKLVKKPSASIIRMCRKYKIKVTRKVGSKRVYKKLADLKRQIKKAKKARKAKKVKRRSAFGKKRRSRRRFRFGADSLSPDAYTDPSDFGYNQTVRSAPGVLSQSSMVVTKQNNDSRPGDTKIENLNTDIFGVYRPFFTEQVPTQIGPRSIGFMAQPNGTLYPDGGLVSGYSSFGKRRRVVRRRRRN